MGNLQRGSDWDPEDAIGVVYSEKRRRWTHERNVYFMIMLALLSIIGLIGALVPFSAVRVAGALAVAASAVTITRSDRAARASRRTELVWLGTTVVLAVGGFVLFAEPWG